MGSMLVFVLLHWSHSQAFIQLTVQTIVWMVQLVYIAIEYNIIRDNIYYVLYNTQ